MNGTQLNGHTTVHQNGHASTKANGDYDATKYKNPSLQVTADHRIKLVDAPIEEPRRGEVTLHIRCSGICG
jgi:L-iditol 2-dehydrogenase